MTDKIIIDGIDVSGCKELQTVVNEEPFCDSSNTLKFLCRGNNCIYKQLKRLEAENAKLKAENEKLKLSERDLSRICQGFKKDIETEKFCKLKYYKTLQEIKAIVCGNYEIIDPQGRKDIIKLITKAESEG